MSQLDGRVAVITGGASGIGEGTVRKFVDEGARFRDGTDTRELEDFYMPQDPGNQP